MGWAGPPFARSQWQLVWLCLGNEHQIRCASGNGRCQAGGPPSSRALCHLALPALLPSPQLWQRPMTLACNPLFIKESLINIMG